jgi:hypothetical protein
MKRSTVDGLVCVSLLIAIAGTVAHVYCYGCDNMAASSALGACYQPVGGQVLCSGFHNMQNCNGTQNGVEVFSFPVNCVTTSFRQNCNKPLSDCWDAVQCVWDCSQNKCIVKACSGGCFHQVIEPTTVCCP